jgi:hypothetical protein
LAAAIFLALTATMFAQGSNATALFREAVKRETALRKEIDTRGPGTLSPPLLERTRVLVGAYEDIAQLFPASPYGDDSLWHGAVLAADAFWEFGEQDDRARALRLFKMLATRYPKSALVKQIGSHVQRLEAAQAGPMPESGSCGPQDDPSRGAGRGHASDAGTGGRGDLPRRGGRGAATAIHRPAEYAAR